MAEARIYLVPALELEPEDRAVISPVWLVPGEVYTRGMLKRPSYKYQTVVVDAMSGSVLMVLDGDPHLKETADLPQHRLLEPVIERARAAFFAERGLQNSGPQGWKAFGSFVSVHVDPDRATLRWRLVVLRGFQALDGLDGQPLKGSELLTALLNESTKKKGGSR